MGLLSWALLPDGETSSHQSGRRHLWLLGESLLLVLLQLVYTRVRPILPRHFLAREHKADTQCTGAACGKLGGRFLHFWLVPGIERLPDGDLCRQGDAVRNDRVLQLPEFGRLSSRWVLVDVLQKFKASLWRGAIAKCNACRVLTTKTLPNVATHSVYVAG